MVYPAIGRAGGGPETALRRQRPELGIGILEPLLGIGKLSHALYGDGARDEANEEAIIASAKASFVIPDCPSAFPVF